MATSDLVTSLGSLAADQQKLAELARTLAAQVQTLTVQGAESGGHDFFITGLTVFVLACFVGYYVVWRVRIGDYRMVYEIDDKIHRVSIVRIRHRKNVYD